MLQIDRHAEDRATPSDVLLLAYDDRKKSRLRAVSQGGCEVAIVLARGTALRDGQLLQAVDGTVFVVRAANEPVSEARTDDPLLLTRAAYHLGNRHVPLQVTRGVLRYQPDHVLDAMVRDLGLEVTVTRGPFEPEGGAYAHAGHAHGETLPRGHSVLTGPRE